MMMDRPTRRETLARLGAGFGGMVLSAMTGQAHAATGIHNVGPKPPHYAPKARAVIQLFMHGGPSHVDLVDLRRFRSAPSLSASL